MQVYSKKATPKKQFNGTLGLEPLELPSSSRHKQNHLQSPHSFQNKNSYVNKRQELLSTGSRKNLHQQVLSSSRRVINQSRSPVHLNCSRSPIREIIYIQKSSVSPIRKRVIEVNGEVSNETLRLLDQKFLSFEEKMKKRFAMLEERAGKLTEKSMTIDVRRD